MSDVKKMTPREFRDEGFLQELNRRFLHPIGLALEVVIDDADASRAYDVVKFGLVWDYRDTPEGMLFSQEVIATNEFNTNVLKFDELLRKKKESRLLLFGYFVQPASQEIRHTMQEDFEHFLSYSGLWKERDETKAKLLQAFEAAWHPK